MNHPAAPGDAPGGDDRPPVLKSWGRLYLVVLGNLALLIALFYLLTRLFNNADG